MGEWLPGEVASSTAVSGTGSLLQSTNARGTGGAAFIPGDSHANQQVCLLARDSDELRGMGTTLVAACVDGRKIVIGNVGDSRAYFLRSGRCAQITLDHSYIAEQVRNGIMSPDDAGASPLQSLITRAIGTAESVEPDLFTAALEPGDVVLLTTDGLTRYADADAIANLILATPSLTEACQSLIDTAKDQGAIDNVTCLLLRFSESDEPAPTAELETYCSMSYSRNTLEIA